LAEAETQALAEAFATGELPPPLSLHDDVRALVASTYPDAELVVISQTYRADGWREWALGDARTANFLIYARWGSWRTDLSDIPLPAPWRA
jgi:hypothetical protein